LIFWKCSSRWDESNDILY